jgi:hypothetical protein
MGRTFDLSAIRINDDDRRISRQWRIGMKGRLIALSLLSAAALGSGVQAEDKFQKLTGAQIQAKFAGMEMTDEVHWGAVYQRNGVLITNEMGHKSTGKWRIQKDQLCLERANELGNGCYEVWLFGKDVQLKNKESSVPLEGVLHKPKEPN